jgi:heme oxygenase
VAGAEPVRLSDRLRADTRGWHDALEATGFATAMLAGKLPLDRYVGQLAFLRVVLEALEGELTDVGGPPGSPGSAAARVWAPELIKLPLIERDLAYFGGSAPGVRATEEADAFAREIHAAGPHELLGVLYVLEGSTLGALMLRAYVCQTYRLAEPDGVAYYGSGDRARWSRFTARLNGAITAPEAQDSVVAGALAAYGRTKMVTETLSKGLV